jgi:hypothetical protein
MHRDRDDSALLRRFAGARAAPGRRADGALARVAAAPFAPWCAIVLAASALLCGCNAWQPFRYNPPEFAIGPRQVVPQSNPLVITNMDRDLVWNQVVDVVDDYFRVEYEDPVRLVDNTLTEGRLETYPRTASTILEPWNHDSVNAYERWQATLQSMRRRAIVLVIPDPAGFRIDVQVYKELEDVNRPESGAISLANAETLRNDDALQRLTNPVGGQVVTRGWIGIGRDTALEQVILMGIQARTGGVIVPGRPVISGPVPGVVPEVVPSQEVMPEFVPAEPLPPVDPQVPMAPQPVYPQQPMYPQPNYPQPIYPQSPPSGSF